MPALETMTFAELAALDWAGLEATVWGGDVAPDADDWFGGITDTPPEQCVSRLVALARAEVFAGINTSAVLGPRTTP